MRRWHAVLMKIARVGGIQLDTPTKESFLMLMTISVQNRTRA